MTKMTLEEAIGIVKCAIGEVEWNYPLDYAEAFEVAIEALEKQIPKKPYFGEALGYKGFNGYYVRYAVIGFYIPTKYLIRVIHSALFVGRRLTGRR